MLEMQKDIFAPYKLKALDKNVWEFLLLLKEANTKKIVIESIWNTLV
jgi:hypothetical protein